MSVYISCYKYFGTYYTVIGLLFVLYSSDLMCTQPYKIIPLCLLFMLYALYKGTATFVKAVIG